MKPSKAIGEMYTYFTDIVNGLKVLGKSFSHFKLVNKILRSIPKSWDHKVTTIPEANCLNNFSLEKLIGFLMTYEMTCITYDELENNLPKNRKDIALRTKEGHLGENLSDNNDDDDLALLIIKFKIF